MHSASTEVSKAAQAHGALLEAALLYAQRGWRVFPAFGIADGKCECPKGAECQNSGKHPRISHWPELATTDQDQIRAWWKQSPNSNLAIATGVESGLVVIDLDIKPGKNGVESLKALGTVPPTKTVRTGSKGLHLYYLHPGGHIPSSSNRIAKGVDVRADGGYVIAPPSMHISGRRYE